MKYRAMVPIAGAVSVEFDVEPGADHDTIEGLALEATSAYLRSCSFTEPDPHVWLVELEGYSMMTRGNVRYYSYDAIDYKAVSDE